MGEWMMMCGGSTGAMEQWSHQAMEPLSYRAIEPLSMEQWMHDSESASRPISPTCARRLSLSVHCRVFV